MVMAERVPMAPTPPTPKRVCMTETTLSLAMKPLTREVMMRQSSRPMGRSTGATKPEMVARMLPWESSSSSRLKLKLERNQTTMVAMRITEKARCRKSRDFSQSSCPTFRGLGIR